MARLINTCDQCGRIAKEISRSPVLFLPSHESVNLECGHFYLQEIEDKEFKCPDFEFEDKTKLYPFQKENIELIVRSGFHAGVFDEMGLGKTITALGILRVSDLYPQLIDPDSLYPVAILVKAGLRYQWLREIWHKLGHFAQIVEQGFQPNFDISKIHIHSQDSLRNLDSKTSLPYKTIIIDECQQIKNPESKRTKSVIEVIAGTKVLDESGNVLADTTGKNVIALSGTPIKNHAGEFFPILNILKPEIFPSYNGFLRYWTRSYWTGKSWKLGGLADFERFRDFTKEFLIRHERKDVLPDLPPVQRNFLINVLADNLSDAYDDELRDFITKYQESKEGTEIQNVLAIMARMRHIVGLSKTNDAVQWVSEFVESHEENPERLVIFHHHEDVGKILFVGLSRYCSEIGLPAPIWLSEPGIDDGQRQSRVDRFVQNPGSLLIASTLKSGEGLNLQCCSNCLVMERQWNSANEEQAEGRFSRIGSTAISIAANYLVCANSIDEYFSEIVERKRQYLNESNAVLAGKDAREVEKFDESSVMKELADTLFRNGLKKFSIDQGKKKIERDKVLQKPIDIEAIDVTNQLFLED